MREFKFACPVCGQHITCDSAKGGTPLNCPTCFQKLVVPHAPEGDASKLVLNAALARNARPLPSNGTTNGSVARPKPSASKFPLIVMGGIALICVAVAFLSLRETKSIRAKHSATNQKNQPSSLIPTNTSNAEWTLNLANATIPDTLASGRIHGRVFNYPGVTFQNGTLNFRQPPKRSPDLGLMIVFSPSEAWEFAGKSVNIETNLATAPKVLLRWKDDQQQLVARTFENGGYALKLEFGRLSGNHLPGRIYFCAPDEAKSIVAGTFIAEILKPSAPKPNAPAKAKRAR